MEKRYAMRRKTEIGVEYATFMTWQGPVVPVVHDNYWSEDIQKATLLRPLHLNAERKGRTTQFLIEEHLPEVELVEVSVSLKGNAEIVEPGDLGYFHDVNTKARIYATITRLEVDSENGKTKAFHLEEDGDNEEGFNYLDEFTLVCKARCRLDR